MSEKNTSIENQEKEISMDFVELDDASLDEAVGGGLVDIIDDNTNCGTNCHC